MSGVERSWWLLHPWEGTRTEHCKPLSAVLDVGQTIFHNGNQEILQGVLISQTILTSINNLHFQMQFHFTALESSLAVCLLWQVKTPDTVYPYKKLFHPTISLWEDKGIQSTSCFLRRAQFILLSVIVPLLTSCLPSALIDLYYNWFTFTSFTRDTAARSWTLC